jgi:hypothetical protein
MNGATDNQAVAKELMGLSDLGRMQRDTGSSGSGRGELCGCAGDTSGLQANIVDISGGNSSGSSALPQKPSVTGFRQRTEKQSALMKRIRFILGTIGFALAMIFAKKAHSEPAFQAPINFAD